MDEFFKANVAPDATLERIEHCGEDDQVQDHLDAKALAFFHFRVRGPCQKRRDILGVLFKGRLGPVFVIYRFFIQRLGHENLVARIIFVVIGAFGKIKICGCIVQIPGHQAIDIIGSAFAGLGDDRKIGRKRAAIGKTRGICVGKRFHKAVRQFGRAHIHFAFVIGAVFDFIIRCHGFGLIGRETNVHQIAVINHFQRVTPRTDLKKDL